MPKFDVWFELYGKKMLVRGLEATNENEAKKTIRWKIRFDKVQEVSETKTEDALKEILGVFENIGIKL